MKSEVPPVKHVVGWSRARWEKAEGRSGQEGFTLIEILVVITIIGLIMGLVGPRVLNYLGQSKAKTADIQISSLASALDLYYLDNGRYPTTNEGLTALVKRPAGASNWNGPYLKGSAVPLDPWGNSYVYRQPGQHGAYDLSSNGPTGREGGSGENTAITNRSRR